jgi:glucose-6-phosphate dehydrogenase assembly protein OpcA
VSSSRLLGLWSSADADVGDAEAAIRRIRDRDPAGTLRNAVVSLVVLVDDARDAITAVGIGDALGVRVPSRVIVVSTGPGRPSGTKASVKVGLLERGDAAPLCVEQVRLHVSGEAVDHLDLIVGPWILPGLPLAVWLPRRVPRPAEPVVADAERLIVDSDRLGRPLDETELAALRDPPAVDLVWVRLRPWRRLLADAFTGADMSPFAPGVDRVDITGGLPWSVLLAGWLLSGLELPPSSIRLGEGDQPAVHLWAQDRGRRAEVTARRGDAWHVRVTTAVAGAAARQHLVRLPEDSLVADVEAALTAPAGHDETWARAAAGATVVLRHR